MILFSGLVKGELKRIQHEIDPYLKMTEIADRIKAGGKHCYLRMKGHSIPVLANLFGTPDRVAMGMGQTSVTA